MSQPETETHVVSSETPSVVSPVLVPLPQKRGNPIVFVYGLLISLAAAFGLVVAVFGVEQYIPFLSGIRVGNINNFGLLLVSAVGLLLGLGLMFGNRNASGGGFSYLWREWVRPVGEAVVIAVLITTFLFTTVAIDGQSDQPSILSGERVFVPKYETWLARLGIMKFQRGDLVVLKPPKSSPNSEKPMPFLGNIFPKMQYRPFFIKRIVGIPGDTISLVEGKIAVNGVAVNETHTVPYWKARKNYDDSSYLANSKSWPFRKDTGENKNFKLSKNQYFVMGDNRSQGGSEDSRVFGPVTLEEFAGRATFVWWPIAEKVVEVKVGNQTYYRPVETDYNTNKPTEDGVVKFRMRPLPRPEAWQKLNEELAKPPATEAKP